MSAGRDCPGPVAHKDDNYQHNRLQAVPIERRLVESNSVTYNSGRATTAGVEWPTVGGP